MAKTLFENGTPLTPELLNKLNNPTYAENPSNDGEIPYPPLQRLPVRDELDIADLLYLVTGVGVPRSVSLDKLRAFLLSVPIGPEQLEDDSVDGKKITTSAMWLRGDAEGSFIAELFERPDGVLVMKNGVLPSWVLADKAVTNAKLADDSVGPENLKTGAVKTDNIGEQAVGPNQLRDEGVTKEKLDPELRLTPTSRTFVTVAENTEITEVTDGMLYVIGQRSVGHLRASLTATPPVGTVIFICLDSGGYGNSKLIFSFQNAVNNTATDVCWGYDAGNIGLDPFRPLMRMVYTDDLNPELPGWLCF